MITDKETNFVYFSDRIKKDKRYESFWNRLRPVLIQNKIPFGFIANTRDIWCRDYMASQKSDKDFIQFTYFPDYLVQSPQYISTLTIPSEVKIIDKFKPVHSDLIIDGGNIVKSNTSIVLTDKIFKANHPRYTHDEVISELKTVLNVDNVFIIPMHAETDDISGHADGMVRFLDDTTLLVSDYSYYPSYWKKRMDEALDKTGLKIITFPSVDYHERNKDGDYTAIGIYINFAQIGKNILFPVFELPEDIEAMERIKALYPGCNIIPVNSREIAQEGGVLNCITWNIKIVPIMTLSKHVKEGNPSLVEQEEYVYERLDFYLSNYDYELITTIFSYLWNNNSGNIVGDGDFKNMMYRELTKHIESNHIPQEYVDTTVNLILEYLESIGQYESDFSAN